LNFVFVVIPSMNADLYAAIKTYADKIGCLTICCCANKFRSHDLDPQKLSNMAMKVNFKLGGYSR